MDWLGWKEGGEEEEGGDRNQRLRPCSTCRGREVGGWVGGWKKKERRKGRKAAHPSIHPPTHPPTYLTIARPVDMKSYATMLARQPKAVVKEWVGGWVVGWVGG